MHGLQYASIGGALLPAVAAVLTPRLFPTPAHRDTPAPTQTPARLAPDAEQALAG
ncbi:hypothetical protein GCM10020367_24240 [Streptomyces sannanensis]|uniref:MFS transporter n=1 Tax=Streptomyces sannanensis TaxID=285536 RepID=A0ABP6S9Z6_9ACTN